jgi:hypothetical protein
MASNPWLSRQLGMGSTAGVTRYVGEAVAGMREATQRVYETLNAKITP